MDNKNEELIKQLTSAKVYDLGQPYWWGMPVHPADPPFLIYLYRYHEHTKKTLRRYCARLGIRRFSRTGYDEHALGHSS